MQSTIPQPPAEPSKLMVALEGLLPGVLAGLITVIASVSLAAMIFTGPLSPFLGYGISSALVASAVIGLIVSLLGSCGVAIAIPQDRTAPLLAIMASGIVAGAPVGMQPDALFSLTYAAIIATTVITGLFLLGLGIGRAGGLMRFIPYSVLAGFFTGTGWLLFIGGLRVMTGLDMDSLADAVLLAQPDQVWRWLPGLVIALAIVVAAHLIGYAIALPLVLLLSTIAFFTWAYLSGLATRDLVEKGLLLGTLDSGRFVALLKTMPRLLDEATWVTLFGQWTTIGTILVISSLSILLTGSALELLTGEDVDINRELRVAGIANLAAGAGGGMVGFHSLSISSLVVHLGGKSRLIGVAASLIAAAALVFGIEMLSYLPRPLLGGLLLFMGFSFLSRWLLSTWHTLPRSEYLVVPLILVVIAGVGFIEGVLAGLLAALLLFVLNYSRASVIRHELFGDQIHSTVERNFADERHLRENGHRLYVLKLRGYLFFGTATHLSTRVREQVAAPCAQRIAFVVLDFSQVSGIDASASYAFNRLHQTAGMEGFVLVMTGLNDELKAELQLDEEDRHTRTFADLDHGLEWCEDQLLEPLTGDRARSAPSILSRLEALFSDPEDQRAFKAYLEEISFPENHTLMAQGASAGDVLFLERGEVSVYLQGVDGSRTRLRRTGSGTVIGEIGFYLDSRRSASVIADRPGTAYRLTQEALARMESEHPEFAAALHRFMADMLAERLLHTTKTLETVIQ